MRTASVAFLSAVLALSVGTGCKKDTGSTNNNNNNNNNTTAECGNGAIEAGEVCDGSSLGGTTCQDLGFAGGQLGCGSTCITFYTGTCTGGTTCGNTVVEANEACDGTDLNGADCGSLGFSGGTLACGPLCQYDTSSCTGSGCGDGTIDATEVCDGNNLGGATCQSQGFAGGQLTCGPDCTAYDTSGCLGTGSCGDGVLDPGELCDDGNNLPGDGCSADCLSDETCGNGLCDLTAGETCVTCETDCGGCVPQCSDGIDNDGDGFIDWQPANAGDPECANRRDNDESA